MERLPTLREIQDVLRETRLPEAEEVAKLQRERDLLLQKERDDCFDPEMTAQINRIRTQKREQREFEAFCNALTRTLVVVNPETRALQVIALTPQEKEGIPSPVLRGWVIYFVVGTFKLNRCQRGDFVPLGLVVSVDGGPLLPQKEIERLLCELIPDSMTVRERREYERLKRQFERDRLHLERLDREQALIDRQEQEELEAHKRQREARDRQRREEEARAMEAMIAEAKQKIAATAEESATETNPVSDELPVPPRSFAQTHLPPILGLLTGCGIGALVAPLFFAVFGIMGAGCGYLFTRKA